MTNLINQFNKIFNEINLIFIGDKFNQRLIKIDFITKSMMRT